MIELVVTLAMTTEYEEGKCLGNNDTVMKLCI